MPSLTATSTLLLPLFLLSLLAGLGVAFAVLLTEGRARVRRASRALAGLNLLLTLPLTWLALDAEAPDVRWMFAFAVATFVLVGIMGLRFPARFDEPSSSA